jgi:hypothetical protein
MHGSKKCALHCSNKMNIKLFLKSQSYTVINNMLTQLQIQIYIMVLLMLT